MADEVLTTEWGRVPRQQVARVRCPVCKTLLVARLSAHHERVELARHGRTSELECPGGGKWYGKGGKA